MIKFLAFIVSIAVSLLGLTACSGLQVLNVITPHDGYNLHQNIPYGSLPRQKLDVYVPEHPDQYHTVVFFLYGGSWQMGSKDLYRFVGQNLANHGITAVIADYRLYPQAYYPAYVQDAALAMKWTHDYIGEYEGNNHHIYVAGHSAGAHLAMMLTLNQEFLREVGGSDAWIKGTIGIAGPYDFLPFTDPKIKDLFSKVPDAETQPINYVRPHLPPILLLHGQADDIVGLKNSQHLAEKLNADKDSFVFKTYNGDVGHITIALALSARFENRATTLSDMLAFIQTQNTLQQR